MASPEETQTLVSDLRSAFSSRMQAERKRRAEAAKDARERGAGAAGRRREVVATLDELHRERTTEAAKDARERGAGAAGRRREVVATLHELHRERTTEAAKDARERGAGAAGRRREVVATLHELHRERTAVHAELLEVGAIWRDHSAAIASLRGRASVSRGRASVSSPLPSKAARAGAPEQEAPVVGPEKVPARENPAEGSPRVSAAAVLSYLANHPDGARLTELEGGFKTPRIVLARILSKMIADDQVRRDEKTRLYFAA